MVEVSELGSPWVGSDNLKSPTGKQYYSLTMAWQIDSLFLE